MNFIQRLIMQWWALWAAAFGLDVRRLVPLPAPLVDPRLPAADLIADAEAHAAGDARSMMVNPWSFGGPDDEVSDRFDPGYVRALRHRCRVATASLREARRITDERAASARRKRDEAAERMREARDRMRGLAAQDERADARANGEEDPAAPDPEEDEQAAPDEATPWEGETMPLRLPWRLLIIFGLVAAELPVQFYVFDYLLAGDGLSHSLSRWMSVMTSAITVFGPFIGGVLLRSRAATGAERRIGYAVLVLVAGWLSAVYVLGTIRGRVLEADTARPSALHVTPTTVMVMFVALLLVIGTMSFMLGLARRHPFQEAYIRHRRRRDHFEMVMNVIISWVNPAYRDRDGGDDGGDAGFDEQERAIEQAYAAAEEAYFATLVRVVGDPAFTEAVQHRRGLRPAQ